MARRTPDPKRVTHHPKHRAGGPEPAFFVCPAEGIGEDMTMLGVGSLLAGQFRLIQKLGEGGMGELYLAEQLHVDRHVAVKLVHPHLASHHPEAVVRLRREAKALGQINHPHVVQLFWYSETEQGRPYLVMEYVPGRTLTREARTQQLTVERALRIALQVSEGLAAAHRHGIVHRDLKPDNIMLTQVEDDTHFVKLLDFGIAKLDEQDENNLTRTGLVVGTPQYMAPERIEYGTSDARTDVYALGLILYEMLTGHVPFHGETPYEILRKHVNVAPEPLSRVLPGILPELDMLVLRCLEKDPADRYAHGAELEDELRLLIDVFTHSEQNSAESTMRVHTMELTAHDDSHPPSRELVRAEGVTWTHSFSRPSIESHARRSDHPPLASRDDSAHEPHETDASTLDRPSEGPDYGAPTPSVYTERNAPETDSWFRKLLGTVVFSLRLFGPAAFALTVFYWTTLPEKRRDPEHFFYPLWRLFQGDETPPPPPPELPGLGGKTKSSNTSSNSSLKHIQTQPSTHSKTPIAAKPEPELERRQAAYVDKCLNRSAARMYDSFARYRSWADDTGPTGSEQNVYGLYTLQLPEECKEALAEDTQADELNRRATAYWQAFVALVPLTEQAGSYYESEGWRDDQMHAGKALHERLLPAFQNAVSAEQALRHWVERQREQRDEPYLTRGEPSERVLHAVRVAARELLQLGNRPWRKYRMLDRSELELAIDKLDKALDQLDDSDESRALKSMGGALLVEANKTKRRLGEHPGWSTGERTNLDNRAAQWMVAGSPASLLRVGEAFLNQLNDSSVMKRIPIVEPLPLAPFPEP